MTPEIIEDCTQISAYLAAGFTPKQIRQEMKLSKRQWSWRMRHLRRNANDAIDVWCHYSSKTDARYRQLEQIRQAALNQPRPALDVARRAISDMIRVDKQKVEVGQELGVYKKVAKKLEVSVTNPTLDMLYEVDVDDIETAQVEDSMPPMLEDKVVH